MSNLARNTFEPPNEHSVVLKYRTIIKWSYFALLGMGLVGSAFFALGIVSTLYRGRVAAASELSVTATLTCGVLLALARFLYKPLAFSTVEVKKDQLVLVRMGETIVIPYDEIAAVEIKHVSYTAGLYTLVLKNKKSYRFTLVLVHSEKILEAIQVARPQLINPKDYAAYMRTAVFADHDWQRFSEWRKKWWSLAARYAALPLFQMTAMSSVKTGSHLWKYLLFFASMNILIGFVLQAGSSMIAVRQFHKRWNEKTLHAERDLRQEKTMARAVFAIHLAVSLLLML